MLAAIFALFGCGEFGDITSPPDPAQTGQTVTYTGTAYGATYTLVITENTARYAAKEGDTYELTVTVGSKKSTGTVSSVAAGGVLTLKPANATKTFTATVSETGLTAMGGEITWTDDTFAAAPSIMNDTATLRYETVPYVPGSGSSNSILARAAGDSPYNLVFSAFDNISDSYYYVFLLGHVNLVPLAYRQAVAYNGTTPVTIGYSASNVTESSIAQSVEQATEHSFSTNMSHGWEFSTEFGFKGPVAHANFQVAVHGEYGQETTDSRSTTNTYETAQSKSSEITDEISLTIGDHNEPPGLYRYSLFTITDLYYVLETDQNKTTVKKAYASWCARPTTYWALDYEPELGGSFRKTAPGALLAIPNPVLSDLPTPTDNNLTQIPPERAAIPVADNKSGNYTESVTVTLSSETPDATIYYTTDGTTPTTSSTVYSIPIAIPNACSLRAIAVADGMENSTVMIENYAINEEPLQTSWTITISSSRTVTDKQTWVDIVYIPGVAEGYHNYDASKLKTAGYAYIQMKGSFKGKDIIDGWVWLDIKKGANGSGTTWYYYHDYDIPSGGFYTMTIPRADPYILIPLDDFDMNFQMIWDASGKDDDKWELGQRTLTFTAVRN